MIERHLTLCANGRAALAGYASELQLGYPHNSGVYRVGVTLADEWAGTTVRAFWQLPDQREPLTTLVADGGTDVPALVTAQGGSGTVTFEGSDGTRTVASASVPYTVLTNAGTEDPTLPEPGTPAWQQLLAAIQKELRTAASGLSETEKGLILALFKGAAYTGTGMQTHYDALAALWDGSKVPETPDQPTNPDTPDKPSQPEEPDTPSGSNTIPGETPVYELAASKQFLPDNKECIDTDVKLFADISSKPTWTVLIDATDFSRLKNLTTSPVMFYCSDTDEPRFSVMCWQNGGVYLDLYGVQSLIGWFGGSSSSHWRAYVQIKGSQYRVGTTWGSTPEDNAFADLPGYTANIASSLVLGACRDAAAGTVSRYWDGTLNEFVIYDKELTNAQLTTWLEGGN